MKKEQYFRNKIKEFYKKQGRDFHWRKKKLTPFQILIFELFLKKTRAESVEKFMPSFLNKYPSNKELIRASETELLDDISVLGLGNQRTRALKKISVYLQENFNSEIPDGLEKLMKIPHVGMYIAGATLCFGFNKRVPILDVNSSRIISRVFSIDNNKDIRDNKELHQKAQELLPRKDVKKYNWGLLDLGAIFCKPRPLCSGCPITRICDHYFKNLKK